MKIRLLLKTGFSLLVIMALASCATRPSVQEVNAEGDRAKAVVQGSSTPEFPATPGQAAPSQGSASPQSGATQIVQSQSAPAQSGPGTSPAGPGRGLSQEEQVFLADYLNRLSYLVY